MEPASPAGLGYAVSGPPIWLPGPGPQGGVFMQLQPATSAARPDGEHACGRVAMGMTMMHAHAQPRYEGYQLPDGHFAVHAQPPDPGTAPAPPHAHELYAMHAQPHAVSYTHLTLPTTPYV